MSKHRRRGLREVREEDTHEVDDVTNKADADDDTCKTVALRGSQERWAVIPYVALPAFLRDNEYLLKGHRPQLPTIKECFKSMFRNHTETWNIWTHFLGMVAFVLIAMYMLTRPSAEVSLDKKLVFCSFFIGAIFCLGCSALYHTLSCHSHSVSKLLAKLDYVGIIVLIVLSYPPWLHYGFHCRHVWKYVYFGSVGVCGIACVVVVMKDRFSTPKYRWLRAVMFTALGMVGVVPGLHYILSEGWWDAIVHAWWLIFMGLLYVGGALIYGARIPERIWPGKFDIVGQSHQIMHMCVIGGAFTCYYGARELAQHRIDNQLCV